MMYFLKFGGFNNYILKYCLPDEILLNILKIGGFNNLMMKNTVVLN
jgi:hypothetical protein